MSDLVEFARRVKERLEETNRQLHWTPEEAQQYMAAVAARRARYEEIAQRIIQRIVRPRLETVAAYFPNANMIDDDPLGHGGCWFGYCERFPASTKVAFAVEHDVRFEKVAVCYEVWMTPLFFKINDRDRMTLSLEELDETAVAAWVEARLLEFLDDFLRIDRGGEELEDEAATDPVCGMRLARSAAAASEIYCGHPYFFCSTDCREKFARQPTAYVEVKTF